MIADSCFLIDLLRNKADAVKKAHELRERGIGMTTTTITVFELWRGFEVARVDEREKTLDLLSRIRAYALDESCARIAGQIAGVLKRTGESIDPEDSLIAGIAVERKEALLTKNTKHFARIPGLMTETY
jgi:predicted nucleic acid-binding protein